MSAPKTETEENKKPRSKKRFLLVMAVGTLVLAGAGAGGFFWWRGHQAAQAAGQPGGEQHEAADTQKENDVAGALPFEPFIVNLADAEASRYLKADIKLLVSGVDDLNELEEDDVLMLRLRSAILEHLSQQTSEVLVTPEGKDALKKTIAEHCSKILGHAKVTDVLFAEFVVQF